jgi:hemolysin D
MKRRAETAFLPAALEVEQSPASPIGRAVIWLIVALFVLSLIWATVGRVDIVAVAPGRIVPHGYSKVLRAPASGEVRLIAVQDGQSVRSGDLLLEFDTTTLHAERRALELDAKRLASELNRQQGLIDRVQGNMAVPDRAVVDGADPLLLRQWEAFEARYAVLQRQAQQHEALQTSAQHRIRKIEDHLAFLADRQRSSRKLAEQDLVPREQLDVAEHDETQARHDLVLQRHRLVELVAEASAIEARMVSMKADFLAATIEKRDGARHALERNREQQVQIKARVDDASVRAPVDGVVQQLEVHHLGAIVAAGEQLLVLVPQDGTLAVEANLANKDAGFVAVGQTAEVKIDAFPFTRYGTIPATVTNVSRDAVVDESGQLVFSVRLSLDSPGLADIRLGPGMRVSVETKTGKRRLIEYLLGPLLRYRDESLRER